jgi:glycosyltransferase involved in cell wall biosynthesis
MVSTGQTLTELAEQLVAEGVDVEVLCGPPTIVGRGEPTPRRLVHAGIRVRRVWGTAFPKLSLFGRIVNQLTFTLSVFLHLLLHRPRRPILVLTNPPFLAIVCGVLRVLRLGPPYLYLVFDVYPETAVRLGLLREASLAVRFWERLNRFAFKHASSIVVIGRCMKEVISRKLARGGLAVNGKLRHIHVWCDDRAIEPVRRDRNPFVEAFGLEGKFVVGYFGNMGRFHDLETILEAAERLRGQRDVVFLFVGEGHKKKWAMAQAAGKGLDNCRFHGYVARRQLSRLLSVADAGLVSLSEGQEGLSVPSKTFGLMAAGVPVLAVVPPGCEIARIVGEEDCGVWIEPGQARHLAQAIVELRADRQRLRRLGAHGRAAISRRYSLRSAARQYADLICDLGEGRLRRAVPEPEAAAVTSAPRLPNDPVGTDEVGPLHREDSSALEPSRRR